MQRYASYDTLRALDYTLSLWAGQIPYNSTAIPTRTMPTVWILAAPLVATVLPWALVLYPGVHGSSPQ